MRTQIEDRRLEIQNKCADTKGKRDIFTMLVEANEDEAGKFRLDDQELVSICSHCNDWHSLITCRLGTSSSCCLRDTVKSPFQLSWRLLTRWPAETTAHSLAATLGFLSINEDIQEEAFQQIISVAGYDHDPVSVAIPTNAPTQLREYCTGI